MKKWIPWLIIVLLLIWICTLYYTKHNIIEVKSDKEEIQKIEYINDSIITVIDSSNVRIEYINNWYEKELVNITNQSVAADVEFFTNYLEAQDDK